MLVAGDLVFYVDLGRDYDPEFHVLFIVTEGPYLSENDEQAYVGIKSMDTGHFRWCNIKDLAVFSKSPSQNSEDLLI